MEEMLNVRTLTFHGHQMEGFQQIEGREEWGGKGTRKKKHN